MKKYIFFLLYFLLMISGLSFGQNAAPWYTVNEVGPKVWQIGDHGADNMYLVEGRDSVMLIDNGLGVADIMAQVRKLTSKPVIVVITHGHPDHAGSDYQFEKVYINPLDSSSARSVNEAQARAGSSSSMLHGNTPSAGDQYKGKICNTKMVPVHDGSIFNLGDRKIQVIETPGHTPGEIVLLDIQNKLLFTGDNNNLLVWLFLKNCLPLHEYLASLEKQAKRLPEFTILLPGHGAPIPSDFIKDQVACVKGILDGSLERKPYQSFAGNAMICTFGRASVAFDPGNL
jgi:glyoxylase-like metal-dependent hydrolase (beta-lactamase superfamily II)